MTRRWLHSWLVISFAFVAALGAWSFDNERDLMIGGFPHFLVQSREIYTDGKYKDTQFTFLDVADDQHLRPEVYASGFFGFENYDNYHSPLIFAFSHSRVFVYRTPTPEVHVYSWSAAGRLEYRSTIHLSGLEGSLPQPIVFFDGRQGTYLAVAKWNGLKSLLLWKDSEPDGAIDGAALTDPGTQALQVLLSTELEKVYAGWGYGINMFAFRIMISLWQDIAEEDLVRLQTLIDQVKAAGSLAPPLNSRETGPELLGATLYFPEGAAFNLKAGTKRQSPSWKRMADKEHAGFTGFRLDRTHALMTHDYGRESWLWSDEEGQGLSTKATKVPERIFERQRGWARSDGGHFFFLSNGQLQEMTANLTSDVVDFFTADEAKTAAWVQAQDRVSLEKAFSYFADPAPALAKIQETGDKTLVSWFFETITKNRKGQQLWTSRNPLIDAINNQNLELVRYFLKTGDNLQNLRSDSGTRVGPSPLASAARSGNLEICRLIVDAGADVHALEGGWGFPRNAVSEASTDPVKTYLKKAGVPSTLPVSSAATIVDVHVRLRVAPSLAAPVLKILEKGESVKITEVTAESITIEKRTSPWAHVTDSNGANGWVWAAFVNRPSER